MTESMSADSLAVEHPLFQTEGDGSSPISALQLQIVRTSPRRAALLNEQWHSRMPKIGCPDMCNPCFAATFDNRIYAVAMWSLPIAANRITNGNLCLELRRLAIAANAPKNTASRMLAIMRRLIKKQMPQIVRLLSYQDTGVHTGTIYNAAGWLPVHKSAFQSWDIHTKRPGRLDQSTDDKVRWEINV